jgi:hypothetical protein
VVLFAQASKIISSGTLPRECTNGAIYWKTGAGKGLYGCDAGTWQGPYVTGTSGGAPSDAEYLVEAAHGTLSAEVVTGTTYMTTASYASRQAATKDGRLFLPSNGFYVERDTASAWAPWGPIFSFTVPVDGDFAWINQGGASVSTTNGGIYLLGPATTGPNFRIRKKAAPATPYTITVAFLPAMLALNFQNAGLVFREAGTGELHSCQVAMNTASISPILGSIKWSSPTAFSADYVTSRGVAITGVVWLRIADNGTSRICSYSSDGQNFIQFHSVSRTDFLTADEVGFFVNDETNTFAVSMTLLSWKQG